MHSLFSVLFLFQGADLGSNRLESIFVPIAWLRITMTKLNFETLCSVEFLSVEWQ